MLGSKDFFKRKMMGTPKNLGVYMFPDPVGHFAAPCRPFWIFEVLIEGKIESGGERVPPAALGWYSERICTRWRWSCNFLVVHKTQGFKHFWEQRVTRVTCKRTLRMFSKSYPPTLRLPWVFGSTLDSVLVTFKPHRSTNLLYPIHCISR